MVPTSQRRLATTSGCTGVATHRSPTLSQMRVRTDTTVTTCVPEPAEPEPEHADPEPESKPEPQSGGGSALADAELAAAAARQERAGKLGAQQQPSQQRPPPVFVPGEIVHIRGIQSELGHHLNGRQAVVLDDISAAQHQIRAERGSVPVYVPPLTADEKQSQIPQPRFGLKLRNLQWALEPSYAEARSMTQELAGGATAATEANSSGSHMARALYVGLRVSAHSLKAGSNYNGRPGLIIADLCKAKGRWRVCLTLEDGTRKAVNVKPSNLSVIDAHSEVETAATIDRDPRGHRFVVALARSLLFPAQLLEADSGGLKHQFIHRYGYPQYCGVHMHPPDSPLCQYLRFGIGVVGVLEWAAAHAITLQRDKEAQTNDGSPPQKEVDPFTGSDAELAAGFDKLSHGQGFSFRNQRMPVHVEYPSRVDHLVANCGFSEEQAIGDIMRHLPMLHSREHDGEAKAVNGGGPLIDERGTLELARSRFLGLCLANSYEEHDCLPSAKQLRGEDKVMHTLLAQCFDVTIAKVDMPFHSVDGFQFVREDDGTPIDMYDQEAGSPLYSPYFEGLVADDDGNEFMHSEGGELLAEQCIAEDLNRKGLRVVFDDLPAALKAAEEYGDDETMSRIEWAPDPNVALRDGLYALCMARHGRLGAASPARVLEKDVLQIVASFAAKTSSSSPSTKHREFYTPSDVFLPMAISARTARLTTCIVTPEDYYSSTRIECTYTMSCLIVRLRACGHPAYSTMREVYADAQMSDAVLVAQPSHR